VSPFSSTTRLTIPRVCYYSTPIDSAVRPYVGAYLISVGRSSCAKRLNQRQSMTPQGEAVPSSVASGCSACGQRACTTCRSRTICAGRAARSRYLLSLYRRLRRTHERSAAWICVRRHAATGRTASASVRRVLSLLADRPNDAMAFAFYGERFLRANVERTLNLRSAVTYDEVGDSGVRRSAVWLRSIDN